MALGAVGTGCIVAFTATLVLTACAGRGELASNNRAYPLPASFDATRVLSPPPEDQTALLRDLEAVRAAQIARTAEQAAHAEESSAVDVFLFNSVLGPGFVAERLPKTADFFGRVYRSALPYLQTTKDCWSRPRPFVTDPTLAPLARALASTRLRSTPPGEPPLSTPAPSLAADSPCKGSSPDVLYSPSYPSGHATVGAMMAILLAEMVPEQRVALFTRGWAYGDARVVSGVHFPSDIEAGRILGSILVELLHQSPSFRADLDASRKELRQALGYP